MMTKLWFVNSITNFLFFIFYFVFYTRVGLSFNYNIYSEIETKKNSQLIGGENRHVLHTGISLLKFWYKLYQYLLLILGQMQSSARCFIFKYGFRRKYSFRLSVMINSRIPENMYKLITSRTPTNLLSDLI